MVAHEIRGSGSKNQWCGQRDSTQKWWQAAGVLSRPRKCLLMTGAKMSQQIQDTTAHRGAHVSVDGIVGCRH